MPACCVANACLHVVLQARGLSLRMDEEGCELTVWARQLMPLQRLLGWLSHAQARALLPPLPPPY
jgi:hypothetical protein